MEGTKQSSGAWKTVKAATKANAALANKMQWLGKYVHIRLTLLLIQKSCDCEHVTTPGPAK